MAKLLLHYYEVIWVCRSKRKKNKNTRDIPKEKISSAFENKSECPKLKMTQRFLKLNNGYAAGGKKKRI